MTASLVPGCAGPEWPHRPPLVVVSVDTLEFLDEETMDRLGLIHLPDLARRSVRFERAYSTAAWTLPAHASLFTGLAPQHHGVVDQHRGLGPEVVGVVPRLRELGYRTIGFTDSPYLSSTFGFDRGFDLYDGGGPLAAAWRPRLPRGGGPNPRQTPDAVFDRAVAFLTQRQVGEEDKERPLFLFVHTYAVHDYFRQSPWALADVARRGSAVAGVRGDLLPCLVGRETCSAEEWSHLRALYEAEIRNLDRRLGRLLEAVDAALGEDAVVILLSDHGEGFDVERGVVHHCGHLVDELLRVPLLVAGPWKPGICSATVSLVDIAPTLTELAGGAPLAGDGSSLRRHLTARCRPDERAAHAAEHAFEWVDGVRREISPAQRDTYARATIRGGAISVEELPWTPANDPLPTEAPTRLEEGVRRELEALGYLGSGGGR